MKTSIPSVSFELVLCRNGDFFSLKNNYILESSTELGDRVNGTKQTRKRKHKRKNNQTNKFKPELIAEY